MFREATETEGRAEDVVRDRAGLLLRCLSTDEKVKYFLHKCNIFIVTR